MRLAMHFGVDFKSDDDVGMNVFFEQNISKLNASNVFFSWYNTKVKYKHKDDPDMLLETGKFTLKVFNLCQCSFKMLILLIYH